MDPKYVTEFERLKSRYTNYNSPEWKSKYGLKGKFAHYKAVLENIPESELQDSNSVNYVHNYTGTNTGNTGVKNTSGTVTYTPNTGGLSIGNSGGWIGSNPNILPNTQPAIWKDSYSWPANRQLTVKELFIQELMKVEKVIYNKEEKRFVFNFLPEIEAFYYYKRLEREQNVDTKNIQTSDFWTSYLNNKENNEFLAESNTMLICMALNHIMTRIVDKDKEIKMCLKNETRTEGLMLLLINYMAEVCKSVGRLQKAAVVSAELESPVYANLFMDSFSYLVPILIEPIVMLYGDLNAEEEETVEIPSNIQSDFNKAVYSGSEQNL